MSPPPQRADLAGVKLCAPKLSVTVEMGRATGKRCSASVLLRQERKLTGHAVDVRLPPICEAQHDIRCALSGDVFAKCAARSMWRSLGEGV